MGALKPLKTPSRPFLPRAYPFLRRRVPKRPKQPPAAQLPRLAPFEALCLEVWLKETLERPTPDTPPKRSEFERRSIDLEPPPKERMPLLYGVP